MRCFESIETMRLKCIARDVWKDFGLNICPCVRVNRIRECFRTTAFRVRPKKIGKTFVCQISVIDFFRPDRQTILVFFFADGRTNISSVDIFMHVVFCSMLLLYILADLIDCSINVNIKSIIYRTKQKKSQIKQQ